MKKLFSLFTFLIFCMMACFVNAIDLTSDLVARWPLDGNAKDAVGGKDGKLVGSPAWVKARVNKGVELDGTSHVNIPDFSLTTGEITFAAWINGWKAADWAGIVGSRTPAACEMIFGNNDTLHYVWNNNAQNTWDWHDGAVIPENKWAMTALTVESDKATTYVYTDAGGLDQGANKIPHVEQTVGVLNIGWVDCCGGGRYFKGIIDEVMIYKRALSKDELLKLATSGLAVVSPAAKLTTTWADLKK